MMKFSLALLVGFAAADDFNFGHGQLPQDFYNALNHQHSGYKSQIQSNDGPTHYQSNSDPFGHTSKHHTSHHHSSHHPSHDSHHSSHDSHHSSHHPSHDSHHPSHDSHHSSHHPSHDSHHKASHYQPPKPPSPTFGHYGEQKTEHKSSHHHSHQPSHHHSYQPSHHQSHQPSHHQSHHHQTHHNNHHATDPWNPTTSHHQSHHHQTHHKKYHAHDPWNPATGGHSYTGYPVKPDGWYSITQQYSPPRIKFVPDAKKPTFGICNITDEATFGDYFFGTLQIAQLPHKPAQITGRFKGPESPRSPPMEFFWRINELGRIDDLSDDLDEEEVIVGLDQCDKQLTGEEFNPLTERNHYGQANPFQDPTRGRIEKCTTYECPLDDSHDTNCCDLGKADAANGQKYLLQNLSDLLGRSVTAYKINADTGAEEILGCCTISRDETPDYYKPHPASHHSPWNPHPSLRGHGHSGHSHSLQKHGHGHGHY